MRKMDRALDERQRAFKEFDESVFNILKLAVLGQEMNEETFRVVVRDIRLSIRDAARREMMRYTNHIEILVTGRQWRTGWWWSKNRPLHKHITADIVFEPYKASLSCWTDPTAPEGVVCFQ